MKEKSGKIFKDNQPNRRFEFKNRSSICKRRVLEKRKEKYLQSRYKRELERYLNRVVNFVMQGEFEYEDYVNFIDKVQDKLNSCEKAGLYNDYFEKIEKFIGMTVDLKEKSLENIEIRAKIMHEANLIRKAKRKKSYTRKQFKNIENEEIF